MSILLAILKVIGIVLLVILAIVLLLIIFVLLSPIRYESVGKAAGEEILVRLNISWLLRILGVKGLVTEDRISLDVRVLFLHPLKKTISWHYPLSKKTDEVPDEVPDEKVEETGPVPETVVAPSEIKAEEIGVKSQPKADRTDDKTKAVEAKEIPYTPSPDDYEDVEFDFDQNQIITTQVSKTEPESESKKKADKSLLEKAEEKLDGIHRKLQPIFQKAEQGRELLERKDTWKTAKLVKRIVFRILNHLKPREVRLHLHGGTGDPASTGQILGIFYALYPLYADHGDYRLTADFDQKVLRGKYYIKGRILPAVPVFCGLRLLLDKNIRKLIFR